LKKNLQRDREKVGKGKEKGPTEKELKRAPPTLKDP